MSILGLPNRSISKEDLQHIREMKDFDLTMLISEVHDHGWYSGKCMLYSYLMTKNDCTAKQRLYYEKEMRKAQGALKAQIVKGYKQGHSGENSNRLRIEKGLVTAK